MTRASWPISLAGTRSVELCLLVRTRTRLNTFDRFQQGLQSAGAAIAWRALFPLLPIHVFKAHRLDPQVSTP